MAPICLVPLAIEAQYLRFIVCLRFHDSPLWSSEPGPGSPTFGIYLFELPFSHMCATIHMQHLAGYLTGLGEIEHSLGDILDVDDLS